MAIDSPRGFLLHGEVGSGKSMMIDLLAECLPNRKKRRLHYSTFMLNTFSKLEQLRRSREEASAVPDLSAEEYSVAWLARDLVETCPILFLDEFQLPDRAASKILSNLLTGFFNLGGVLIATSNRMPEELNKASGIAVAPSTSGLGLFASKFGIASRLRRRGRSERMFAGHGEFAEFLEILKARCEIWEMEGSTDYRRAHAQVAPPSKEAIKQAIAAVREASSLSLGSTTSAEDAEEQGMEELRQSPDYYFYLRTTSPWGEDGAIQRQYEASIRRATGVQSFSDMVWKQTRLLVYSRPVIIPRSYQGTAHFTFAELCGSALGPADYISLASNYHTFIIVDVPVLTTLLKNEARRFITLLDAIYEARCKLIVTAAAPPDALFFPDVAQNSNGGGAIHEESEGGVYAEVFSEAYQDTNAPFRPNISTYINAPDASTSLELNLAHASPSKILAPDALEDDPPNRARPSSALVDAQGNNRDVLERQPLDFGRTSSFTGEDERFAYKRATSRLWEMCSTHWWDRNEDGWWRPLPAEQRHWETPRGVSRPQRGPAHAVEPLVGSAVQGLPQGTSSEEDEIFRHGASPFRRHSQPPPRIDWTHAWGMVEWGKRAGAWGQGVDGLNHHKRNKDGKE